MNPHSKIVPKNKEELKRLVREGTYVTSIQFVSHKDNMFKHYAYCAEQISLMDLFKTHLHGLLNLQDEVHEKLFSFVWQRHAIDGLEEVVDRYMDMAGLVK